MGEARLLARLRGLNASTATIEIGSMSNFVYLDWNATAPLRPAARQAVDDALARTGNPSSVHAAGRAARAAVEEARRHVAALVGADPRNVVFTSGGTEANSLALTPLLHRNGDQTPRERLLVSAIEHPSVLAGGRFAADQVKRIAVTPAGIVDLDDLRARLASGGRPLVSVMAANNETGLVHPIREVAALVHAQDGLLHVDAVQAVGRSSCSINEMGADLVTISSHKIGGPQGAGAVIWREDALHIADPLLKGGGQERGYRAGTENVAAIAGFGAAAQETGRSLSVEHAHAVRLRERLEQGLLSIAPETVIFGRGAERLANTTLFALAGIKAETALIALDLAGVAVSSGSACSSGKVAASHVLAAMQVAPHLARGAVRVSTGHATSEADIECFLEAWRKCVGALGKGRQEIAA
jgi:cysteine desulfurase